MKVLTITTSYANNYGALIQCYALSRYLNNLDNVECQVIQYLRPDANNSWTVWRKPKTVKGAFKTLYMLLQFREYGKRKQKFKLMRDFLVNYIPFTKDKWTTPDSIRNNPPKADAFICGSDQIWNMKYMFEGKTIYFLDFVKEGKKISYAASIADPWKEEHVKMLTPLLKSFDAISIREKGNLEQVQHIFPNATVVIDPVFLLNKNEWFKFANSTHCLKEPYILCYFLSISSLAVETMNKLHKLTGYKIIHLNINGIDKFHSDINLSVASPNDFVGLISNAALICTNSFHCSAFSVIFKKDFVFIPKGMANERVKNLQEVFQLGDRCMTAEKLKDFGMNDIHIDYSIGAKTGQDFIDYSKQFLDKALFGDGNKIGI